MQNSSMHRKYLLLKSTNPKQADWSKIETEVSSILNSPFHLFEEKWEVEELSPT